jgi:ComF family protein
MKATATFFHFLFPNTCLFCLEVLANSEMICAVCRESLPRNPNLLAHGFEYLIAPFSYQEPISSLITDLKFNGKLKYAKLLGDLLSEAIRKNSAQFPDIIIPVPLHKKRLKERGFNQAHEIAKVIGKKLNIPLNIRGAIRIKNTKAQSNLKAKERHKNLENAFKANKNFTGKHIAIVDDVFTTGATTISKMNSNHARGTAAEQTV